MIVKAIREGLGRMFVFGDYLTRPKNIQRSEEDQARVDKAVTQMSLYQFYACPFCIKTRRAIRKLNLPMQYRNAQIAGQARNDLSELGGMIKVPCLRIEEDGKDRWLYESNDIIAYLEGRFGATA
jgi:glutaredoxin